MRGYTPAVLTSLAAVLLLCATVHVPAAAAQDRPTTHTVQAGETLYGIALRYGLSLDELRRISGIEGSVLRVGQVLRIDPDADVQAFVPSSGDETPVELPVPPGVSLLDVAYRTGVPADTLIRYNPDLPIAFSDGDSLTIPARYATRTIRVRRGDTLYGLASRHRTTVAALRALNRLRSDRLAVGQRLEVPTTGAPDRLEGLPDAEATGAVLEYPDRFAGRLTASGRSYDPESFIVAHPDLGLGTVVLLTSEATGASVFAEVADRMPGGTDHLIEVSRAVSRALGPSVASVELRIVDRVHARRHP